MMQYRRQGNAILDEDWRQIAVVLPANCTKSKARAMAQWIVDKLNAEERAKAIKAEQSTVRTIPE